MYTSSHAPEASSNAASTVDAGERRTSGPPRLALQVTQRWGEVDLEQAHFGPEAGPTVTVGTELGYRWTFLGVDLGFVPAGARRFLPLLPPLWSEVTPAWRQDLFDPAGSTDPLGELTLFERVDGAWQAHVPPGWTVIGATPSDVAAARCAVPARGELVLADGLRSYRARLVPAAPPAERPLVGDDATLLGFGSLLGVLALLFGWVLSASPTPPAAEEALELHPISAAIFLPRTPEKPPPPLTRGGGAAAAGAEGAAGPKRPRPVQDPPGGRAPSRGARDRAVAEEAGLLGALQEAGAWAGVFEGRLDAGLTGGVQGLRGSQGGGPGSGGLGRRGSLTGGGGTAETLEGGWGTRGPGTGEGYGPGGAKAEGQLDLHHDEPLVLGGLDRALIDEVVKRHLLALRYCYQRHLPQQPDLAGKLSVRFVIARDGSVSDVRRASGSLQHAEVEACVLNRFRRMSFPEPRNGVVVVTYPLVFSPG